MSAILNYPEEPPSSNFKTFEKMADKTKLVDYSFSTSESEEEPPPKKRAVGIVKPISHPIPEESAEIPENPESPGNPEIPE